MTIYLLRFSPFIAITMFPLYGYKGKFILPHFLTNTVTSRYGFPFDKVDNLKIQIKCSWFSKVIVTLKSVTTYCYKAFGHCLAPRIAKNRLNNYASTIIIRWKTNSSFFNFEMKHLDKIKLVENFANLFLVLVFMWSLLKLEV